MDFRLNHIHFRCQDLEGSISYYKQVFGAQELCRVEVDGFPWVEMSLSAIPLTSSPKKEGLDLAPFDGRGGCGMYQLALTVEDLERTLVELKARGAEVEAGPIDQNLGGKAAFIKAPDGMQVELIEYQRH